MEYFDVVIIGGGWAGIYSLKHCLERNLKAILLESENEIGGQWVFRPNKEGGVLKSTLTVSSKLYMSPSDFPLPDDAPEFPNAQEILAHFLAYVEHFKLEPHIRTQSQVINVEKKKGRWITDIGSSKIYSEKLVVATGANKVPRYPQEKVFSNFAGKTTHSASFKGDTTGFKGKKVLIVGGSDTACDLAHLLRDEAEVTVSMRKGTWFQARDLGGFHSQLLGVPADMYYSSYLNKVAEVFGDKFLTKLAVGRIEKRWGKSGSGIKEFETHAPYLNTYYTKSRHLVHDVKAGKIKARRGVKKIEGHKIWFEGENQAQNFDHIIYCTGYKRTLSFKTSFETDESIPLWKMILDVEDPSLAWVGYTRAYVTSIVMLAEMQARWVADVFSGEISVPNRKKRALSARKYKKFLQRRFSLNHKDMPFLLDPYLYMKELARDMNQIPNKFKLFLKSPKRVRDIVFNTWSHYQFRLVDRDIAKQKIAEAEIEKLSHRSTSQLLREEAKMIDAFRAYFMRKIKKALPENNPLRKSLLKNLPLLFKAKKPWLDLNLKPSQLPPELATVALLTRLALQNGVLDGDKINFLKEVLNELSVSGANFTDIVKLARVTHEEELTPIVSKKDRLSQFLLSRAHRMIFHERKYDVREEQFIQKLTQLLETEEISKVDA